MSKDIICMYHISIISIKNLDIYQGPLQNTVGMDEIFAYIFLKKWNFVCLHTPYRCRL